MIKLKELLAKFKLNKKAMFSLCAILFLIVIALFTTSLNSTNKTSEQTKDETANLSYQTFVEERLVNIISSIKGLDNVKVYVSVGSSPEIVYATDKNIDSTKTGETTVFSKNSSQTTPVIISEKYPEILGVLIVAKGLTQKINLDLTNSLSLVLNVPISCIQILEGK
ncbi:MAG: hypothetical protein J5689_02565 [Clostridia bacterium]|nr:hypothetical protein [Clostridia bacterium]